MDATLTGAGIAMTDRAYAMSHLAAGRLGALGSTIRLPESYYSVRSRMRPLSDAVERWEAWLVDQASFDSSLPDGCIS